MKPPRDLDPRALVEAAFRDKKREGTHVHYVVLGAIGSAHTIPADETLLRRAIDAALEG